MQEHLREIVEFFNYKGFYVNVIKEKLKDDVVEIKIKVTKDAQEFCEKPLDNNQEPHQVPQ